MLERFINGEPIVLEGCLVSKKDGVVHIQLHPGLTVELAEKMLAALEEATDPVTGRTFVKVTLKPEADIKATFLPRLARLALAQAGATPFSMGGDLRAPVEEAAPPIFAAKPNTGGGGGSHGHWETYQTPWIGEEKTRCYSIPWGWSTDDSRPTSGTMTDQRWVPA